jgi:hypothetical protein
MPESIAADRVARQVPRLPWPLPALLTWLASWGLLVVLLPLAPGLAWPAALPWLLAAAAGALLALVPHAASGWRRVFMAGGFPVSSLLLGAAGAVPAWAWLLPMGLLLAAYPLRAWRDAPLFPTPVDALDGLADALPLADGVRVLDAGCGLGHGLAALHRTWPQVQVEGIEWSGPLRLAAALRCPWARVRRGDMWGDLWQGLALVYLFQRPESMARAWAKAQAELAPGAWLLSLDFAVPGIEPTLALRRPGRQTVWAYRLGADMPSERSLPANFTDSAGGQGAARAGRNSIQPGAGR